MADRYQIFERLDLARINLINSMQKPRICTNCKTIYEEPPHPEWNCPGCGRPDSNESPNDIKTT